MLIPGFTVVTLLFSFKFWGLKQGEALQKNDANHISLPTGPYKLAIKPFGATTD